MPMWLEYSVRSEEESTLNRPEGENRHYMLKTRVSTPCLMETPMASEDAQPDRLYNSSDFDRFIPCA